MSARDTPVVAAYGLARDRARFGGIYFLVTAPVALGGLALMVASPFPVTETAAIWPFGPGQTIGAALLAVAGFFAVVSLLVLLSGEVGMRRRERSLPAESIGARPDGLGSEARAALVLAGLIVAGIVVAVAINENAIGGIWS